MGKYKNSRKSFIWFILNFIINFNKYFSFILLIIALSLKTKLFKDFFSSFEIYISVFLFDDLRNQNGYFFILFLSLCMWALFFTTCLFCFIQRHKLRFFRLMFLINLANTDFVFILRMMKWIVNGPLRSLLFESLKFTFSFQTIIVSKGTILRWTIFLIIKVIVHKQIARIPKTQSERENLP